jgi:hypothetical protein
VSRASKKHVFLAASFAAVVATSAVAVVGCNSGGHGTGLFAAVLAPSFKTAPQADTTGQTDVFVGKLGTGTTTTFAAIQNVTYNISVSSSPDQENVIVDVFDKDGNELKAKTVLTNGGLNYFHAAVSQHVLVVLRPYDPVNTGVNVTKFQITGVGNFSQTNLAINLIVTGDDYTGFGNFNDLKTAQDRANLAAALVQKVQALHTSNGTGIQLTFEGFSLTTAQIQATQSSLVDASGHTIAHTSEQVNTSGYSNIDTSDLDRFGTFGFPANDPTPTRANGLDCFVVHHFSTDGVVGLSPRPGTVIQGNGPGSALCIGAFLQQGGKVTGPRSVDNMAVVLTHEIGHFLGLLHTTTFSPSASLTGVTEAIDDGLTDTPAAGTLSTLLANAKTNGHTTIGVGDGCADESYIMFYQSIPTQSTFSPRQVSIMKTTLSSLAH